MDGSINLPLGGVVAGYTTDSQHRTIKAKDNRYSDRTSPLPTPTPIGYIPSGQVLQGYDNKHREGSIRASILSEDVILTKVHRVEGSKVVEESIVA